MSSCGKNALGGAPLTGGNMHMPTEKMSGGRRRGGRKSMRKTSKMGGRKHRKSYSKSMKGGFGVLETAAVPFGLFALQRFFKGSNKTKKDVRGFGKSVKNTLRRFRR
jgi:hypothetical protein